MPRLRAAFFAIASLTSAVAAAQPSSGILHGVPVSLGVTSHVDGHGVLGTETDVRTVANLGDALSLEALDATLVLVLDLSLSSIEPSGGFVCGDQNNDGLSDTNVDCERVAAELLLQEAADHGVLDRVGLVVFEGATPHAGICRPTPGSSSSWSRVPT